jgi:signal transduction histidine kinase
VSTDKGIDVFRDTPVLTFSSSEGLIGTDVSSVLALKNGLIWIGDSEALNVIDSGRISAIEEGKGLPGHGAAAALFEDSKGTAWVGIDDELMIRSGGQFTKIENLDGKPLTHPGVVVGFTEDVEGNVWALTGIGDNSRLIRIRDRRVQQNILVNDFLKDVQRIAADRESGVWIVAGDGKMVRYRNGNTESISLASPENPFRVRATFVDTDNSVWMATTRGLVRWKDGEVITMDSRNGLPDCLPFFYAIKDDGGSLWIYASCGLMKISAADLTKWLSDPQSQISVRTFGPLEGAFPSYSETGGDPKAVKSGDGRLWFAGLQFVQMIDPGRDHVNPIPPPVHIEGLVADRTNYTLSDGPHLPPLTRDLEIDYTALSFTVPQQVKFRYKLENHDTDWQEAGTRRQAFYSDLGPGEYRFHVIAANNEGVWNDTGATLSFSIAPAWYQTNMFRVSLVVILLFAGWLLYRLRVRQISGQMSARFDERLAERTRVARELHDTFLQTVQGSKLVADHALKDKTDQARLVGAMEQLSRWLEQATNEGRAALNSLRSSTTEKNDLAEAFRRAVYDCRRQTKAEISFSINGRSREMHPVVRDEIYRVGYEAIRNACAHADSDDVEIMLEYAHDLTFSVRDDGVGMEPEVARTGKKGHFGLQGMKERAERIGGKLTIVSTHDSGTAVTLVVPGRIVFRSSQPTLLERIRSAFKL